MSYGQLSPEAARKAEADLAARTAKLEAEIAACRFCKAAKTRALRQFEERAAALGARARYGTTSPNARDGECRKHRERRRLNYVTSPLSETYWSS